MPNILFQMLLRASNAVGYTTYPDNVVRAFIKRSADAGIDVFRIFDSLNSTDNMQLAIEAVREGHVGHLRGRHLLHRRHPRSGAHQVLARLLRAAGEASWSRWARTSSASRTWPGSCKPHAAYALVKALRDEVGVPIHFHTHDTSGINAASVLRAADAGVDIADARHRVDERHDQPALPQQPCRRAAAYRPRHRPRSGGARRDQPLLGRGPRAVLPVRRGPEGAGAGRVSARDAGRPVHQPAPAGAELGLESRWPDVCQAYADANQLVGDIVKVTPSSKVVGDLALFMVTNDLTPTTPDRRHGRSASRAASSR